ncbi:hypothetical protein Lalb_Chr10g0107551 [Lupinus albus]|uniref:Uncharacterized protein n=1 Tax=Lupinus albus TaxID=3870 RepID=A0A6A4PY00_LUPAL|nr:hypothetical protein Lalb_Chr10g0107551 [Lupinus albus]
MNNNNNYLAVGDHKPLSHSETKEKLLSNTEDFVWLIETPLPGKFIIDIEFLDLKISCPKGGDPCSIWPNRSNAANVTQGIHTDITMNACDGSISDMPIEALPSISILSFC